MPVSDQQQEAKILERQERVSRLYLQEYTQRQIAVMVGVSQGTVSTDLAAVKQRWIDSADETTAQRLNKKVAELRQIKNEAWRAWKASKQERQTTTTERTTGGDDGGAAKTKAAVRKEQRDPAAEYMKIVQWCYEKECELWGLTVKKIALTNPDGTKEYGSEPGSRPLAALLAGARAAIERFGKEDGAGSDGGGEPGASVLDSADGPSDAGVYVPSG